MKKEKAYASIIIANFNGEKYLPTCLKSVLQTRYTPFEIIIIDDGSTDKSVQIIEQFKKKDKRILYLRNEKNYGAAASRNKAVGIARGSIIVFLDNDTEVDPKWLLHLVDTLSKNRSIGACQAKIIDFQKRDIVQNIGVKLWASTGWGLPMHQWQKADLFKKEEYIAAISAAMAIRREVFEKINGFDTQEAVVTEDLDVSWRIWLLGYTVVLSPRAIVYHWTKPVAMRSHMGHGYEDIYFHLTKNSLISIVKNYEAFNMARFFFLSLFIGYGRALLVLLKRNDISSLKGVVAGTCWFLLHLPYIIGERIRVQKTRKVSDNLLFKKVIVRSSIQDVYEKYFTITKLL